MKLRSTRVNLIAQRHYVSFTVKFSKILQIQSKIALCNVNFNPVVTYKNRYSDITKH